MPRPTVEFARGCSVKSPLLAGGIRSWHLPRLVATAALAAPLCSLGCSRPPVPDETGSHPMHTSRVVAQSSQARLVDVSPLFHDAQRMMVRLGQSSNYKLGAWAQVHVIQNLAPDTFDTARAAGMIFVDPNGDLSDAMSNALTIGKVERGWRCLWLSNDSSSWKAWLTLVPDSLAFSRADHAAASRYCLVETANPPMSSPLTVIATKLPPSVRLPSVARWDWDSVNHRQYIGIRCKTAWCEIGFGALTPSAPASAPPGFDASSKGVYDVQYSGRKGQAAPFSVRSTIFPDSHLSSPDRDYTAGYTRIALIRLEGIPPGNRSAAPGHIRTMMAEYSTHWKGLDPTAFPESLQRIEFCAWVWLDKLAEPNSSVQNGRLVYSSCLNPPDTQTENFIPIAADSHQSARKYTIKLQGSRSGPFEIPGTTRWAATDSTLGLEVEHAWGNCNQRCCEPKGTISLFGHGDRP